MSISVHPGTSQGRTLAGSPLASTGSGPASSTARTRSRLFTKYVALFVTVVGIALLSNGIFEVFFYYREHKASLIRIQHEQAEAAATKITQFIKEIERQLGWTTQLPWSAGSIEQRRFDALRLLHQVPAVMELAQVDSTGRERLRVSKLVMDTIDSGPDLSKEPKFTEAVARKIYYGPVYFRRESEPYMTLAVAGTRKDAGVSIAEVNLKLIWDVVSQIKVGNNGHAYVVGAQGRLIAHPDISLVLRNTDMSKLAQVRAAQAGHSDGTAEALQGALNIQGQDVLTASAPISPLGWTMFVELPVEEAYAPLYAALQRLAIVLLAASLFAVLAGILLARRMVGPIQALRAGAARIGAGDLAQRISIKTGDELEGLADQFNEMGARLQESYADLERKVESRTTELRESLEQQTATSEVLQVISSSPGELEPVFQAMLANATRLCEASSGVMWLREGGAFRSAAIHGALSEAYVEQWRSGTLYHPSPHAPLTLVMQTRRAVQIPDMRESRSYLEGDPLPVAAVEVAGIRTLLLVPMFKEDDLVGAIAIYRQEVRPFTDKQTDLVTNFAKQAVIAIENTRLLRELRQRTGDLTESLEQQTATSEVLETISSSAGELDPIFQKLLENATRICGAKFGTMTLYEEGGFRTVALYNAPEAYINTQLYQLIRPHPESGLGTVERTHQTVHIDDIRTQPPYLQGNPNVRALADLAGARTVVIVPMLKADELIGTITIFRQEVKPFTDKQTELVANFANQAVIAIENANLLNELRERTTELSQSLNDLRAAQDRLIQTEKLASLGQLTAGIAHEIKNPLNFVNNFSALSSELIDELNDMLKSDTAREDIEELTATLKSNLERVVQHGKRADSIVKNMLLHSREGSGERRPADINAIVEESLNLAYHGARAEKSGFNITLKRDLDPNAGMIDLYPQEITRVLLNLISNGFYAATKCKEAHDDAFEPTLTASTRGLGDEVEIRIRDNGSGIPPEVKEKIFNPFFTTKPAGEGTGLGLSMSHDIIVKQHGGKIDVETEPGVFTDFIITLPRTAVAQVQSGGKIERLYSGRR
ncbi:GAF domain-containing protein [Bradyrhizobium sp. Rc2d]|uniref:GAF domain-containing protein n=1 Tax=Bradyrhizobium sp. Rc2d TaxID=1855321 RepID=UPI000880F6CF|nr:GAF domain-containing protein [Bradyrhizobium sp. Rc2d]SDJ30688.1 GAF domain-containing protein [Bradyrhizobium sp. Rc2d]